MADLKEKLRTQFVGRTLSEVPTPSVVLDLDKLEVNCARMLEATERLGLLWRAHIKSHKTTELTRLQVGDDAATPVSLIVSTITEAEHILPLLQEYQSRGRRVNILFAFPLFPSALPRLAALSAALGPDALTLMVDHPAQLTTLLTTTSSSLTSPSPSLSTFPHPPHLFLKIDTSYGRAGVTPTSPAYADLVDATLAAEASGACRLLGVYSHAGHSYGARGGVGDVLGYLEGELRGLADAARVVRVRAEQEGGGRGREKELVLSVGATPTATVLQQHRGSGFEAVSGLVGGLKGEGLRVEVHAGVYPTLDLQQLATHARDASLMTADDVAISVVAEVASLYPARGANGTTEALINAGTLALGREPVMDKGEVPGQDYSGWGHLMPWGLDNPVPGPDFPRVHGGWQVGRISQEHGILVWQGKQEDEVPLTYGQRVRVWPNHSCIAGAGFDYYLIVDSRNKGREDEVVDVWPRWRGW